MSSGCCRSTAPDRPARRLSDWRYKLRALSGSADHELPRFAIVCKILLRRTTGWPRCRLAGPDAADKDVKVEIEKHQAAEKYKSYKIVDRRYNLLPKYYEYTVAFTR